MSNPLMEKMLGLPEFVEDFGVPFANIIAKINAGLLLSGEVKQP